MKLNFCRVMRNLAQRHGDKEAIVNVERNRRYSFREYHLLTNRIANALRERLAVGRGDKFMLILENDNVSLLQFPTIYKQEGTAVMTNLRDSVDEHRWQVELAKPKVVFIENKLLDSHGPMLRDAGCTIVVMDPLDGAQQGNTAGVLDFQQLIDSASDADNEVALDQHAHTVLLRFTGGTTGRGKCAMYSADNLLACRDTAFANPELGFDAGTRMLHVAPLTHGTQIMFYPTLFAGGTNITMNALDLELWSRVAEAERATHSFLVPTALYRLLELQRAKPRNFASLRTILYGAAPMSAAKLNELIDGFGPIFAQGYASTETPMFVSILDKSEHRTDSAQAVQRMSSAGRVTPGVEVFVTDSEGRELPPGQTGEIRIRSRALIQGYYGNPEGTAAEFVDDAWRSGDLGYIDDEGFLFIVDRLKDMIISGGENVYSAEVENALAQHPAVSQSAVIGVPDERWGERVHAVVVLKPGQGAEAAELVAHCKALIAGYKCPRSVEFRTELPTSPAGKLQKFVLREPFWQGRSRRVN